MNKAYLGISFGFHDSAVALTSVSGKILFAASEERFSRVKGDSSWPNNAILRALNVAQENNLTIVGVCGHENYQLTVFWMLKSFFNPFCIHKITFNQLVLVLERYKLLCSNFNFLLKELELPKRSLFFCDHHVSHALAAYSYSRLSSGLFFVFDAVGQGSSGLIGAIASNNSPAANKFQVYKKLHVHQSIGLFYSSITQLCGFKILTGEYKLMGLAAYGEPVYYDRLCAAFGEPILSSFNTRILDPFSDRLVSTELEDALQISVRAEESQMDQIYMNLAASAQRYLEDLVINVIGSFVYSIDSNVGKQIILGGGVALNCKLTQRIQETFPNYIVSVCPAAGDAGSAVGACQAKVFDRQLYSREINNTAFLGSRNYADSSSGKLEVLGFDYQLFSCDTLDSIVELLIEGKIGAICRGPGEFGPRALGNRSILANPSSPEAIQKINRYIKAREEFRPLAPITTQELAQDFFEVDFEKNHLLDFMLSLVRVPDDVAKLIPSAVHVDGTARLQTVHGCDNNLMHTIISEFYRKSKIPALINTSFNQRGEPIVESLNDALTCFVCANLDFVLFDDCFILRERQEQALLDSYLRAAPLPLD